jgi:hypothetical protein
MNQKGLNDLCDLVNIPRRKSALVPKDKAEAIRAQRKHPKAVRVKSSAKGRQSEADGFDRETRPKRPANRDQGKTAGKRAPTRNRGLTE